MHPIEQAVCTGLVDYFCYSARLACRPRRKASISPIRFFQFILLDVFQQQLLLFLIQPVNLYATTL
jgi:hypothetical protein